MGCGASSQSRYEAKSEDPPVTRRDQQGLLEPTLTRGTSGDDSSINSDQAGMKAPITLAQGNHWAENSPMKERRVAERPWVKPAPEAAPQEAVGVCSPCDNAFEFTCTFPMMVMKMETFMRLKIMQSYEELLKSGDIFEWAPDMGRVFFLSHRACHPTALNPRACLALPLASDSLLPLRAPTQNGPRSATRIRWRNSCRRRRASSRRLARARSAPSSQRRRSGSPSTTKKPTGSSSSIRSRRNRWPRTS